MIQDFLQRLSENPVSTAIRENGAIFPWIEVAHVMAISIVLGSIALIDLRLIGLASTAYPVSRLTKSILPLTWIGFILAAITGLLLFSSNPITYYENFAFRMKMVLLLAAGLNMAVFHLLTLRGLPLWDAGARVPAAARVAGGLSLVIWIAIAACGRWIGFTMAPF